MKLVSKQELNFEEGYLSIIKYEKGSPYFIKTKPFALYEDGLIVGFYKSLNSAKNQARKYYGVGVKWIKKDE